MIVMATGKQGGGGGLPEVWSLWAQPAWAVGPRPQSQGRPGELAYRHSEPQFPREGKRLCLRLGAEAAAWWGDCC